MFRFQFKNQLSFTSSNALRISSEIVFYFLKKGNGCYLLCGTVIVTDASAEFPEASVALYVIV